MSFYLDASVVVPLFVVEDRSAALLDWLDAADGDLAISDLVVAEVGSAISRLVRTDWLTRDEAIAVLDRFDEWRIEAAQAIETTSNDIRIAARFVRKPLPKLLTPDAIHLATCRRIGLTLVTDDTRLQECAEREGVPWIGPV